MAYVFDTLLEVAQQARKDYEIQLELVKELERNVNELHQLVEQERAITKDAEKRMAVQSVKIVALEWDVKQLTIDRETTLLEKTHLLKTISDLERDNHRMVEENKQFLKVSQIIMYEKENTKLKREVEQLSQMIQKIKKEVVQKPLDDTTDGDQLSQVTEQPASQSVETSVEQIAIVAEEPSAIIPTQEDETPEVSVYEKKIKGIVYYVSDDEHMRIFEKQDTGEIGDELGYLELTAGGKYKAVWTSMLQT